LELLGLEVCAIIYDNAIGQSEAKDDMDWMNLTTAVES
jgi:hypothetical protein